MMLLVMMMMLIAMVVMMVMNVTEGRLVVMMVVRVDVWWTGAWWTVTWWPDVWLDATLARLMGVVVWMDVMGPVKLVMLFVIAIPCVCWWNAVPW